MPTRPALDGEAAVAAHWPVDGPHSADDFAQAMLALQHLIRYANHATLDAGPRVTPDPQDAATIVRRLGDALGGLPQLCDQLAHRADHFAADPALHAADIVTHEPGVQAAIAAEALRELAAATARLRDLAGAAASALDTLWLDPDQP
ncbi:hypothetical protein [Nocardia carnea]|uniref:hypothetical protein n=1 Tax=Nocardia carnea TaxID=37328 RepID=UPI002454317B|nr:hypothetical protein [Nocardia carnea]